MQILDEPLEFLLDEASFDPSTKTVEHLAELPGIHIVRNMLSAAECQSIIENGFEPREGVTHPVVWRKWSENPDAEHAKVGVRTVYKAEDQAAALWERAKHFAPQRVTTIAKGVRTTWQAIGLSDRLKFVQYRAGQTFPCHVDGAKIVSEDEKSQVSVLFYLDSTNGGELRFLNPPPGAVGMVPGEGECTLITELKPEPGMMVFFSHKPYLHESAPLLSGRKFVIRTDVMYRAESRETTGEPDRAEALPA